MTASLFDGNGQPTVAALPSDAAGDCPHCGRPMGDLDAGGAVGRSHPETSRDAIRPSYGQDHWKVMRVLAAFRGCVADTIANVLGANPNQTAARLLELRRGGWVQYVKVDASDPRPTDKHHRLKARTRTGSMALVQRLTPAGEALLDELNTTRKATK